MKEPKRYYCGCGEGMFEDDKNGYWVEYSEHKSIVDEFTEQLQLGVVIKSLPESDEIRMKARELDEKGFDQWWWETVYKGNVL